MATSPEPPDRPREPATSPRRPRQEELEQVRDISFPPALRGYDRDAVDAYVVRVNRLLAELETTRSPEAAIERALDQVGEETSGILQRARETSEDITARSRAQADDRVQLAEREAQAVREEAEARVRLLNEDAEAVWQERQRLIGDVRGLAEQLLAVADAAAERFPPAELEEARASEAALAPTEVFDQADDAEVSGEGEMVAGYEQAEPAEAYDYPEPIEALDERPLPGAEDEVSEPGTIEGPEPYIEEPREADEEPEPLGGETLEPGPGQGPVLEELDESREHGPTGERFNAQDDSTAELDHSTAEVPPGEADEDSPEGPPPFRPSSPS